VPDTNEVRIDPVKGTLIRDGVPSILNPDDANALEAALTLKDQSPGAEITVLTMGPPQAVTMLKECLAMGADNAILLSDRAFAGSDTWATSNTLAAAIRKIGTYDIILAGRQAIDGDTAQVGPQIAERLKIPQVTYVQKIEKNGNVMVVQGQLEDGYEVIEVNAPVLFTAVKELGVPRYMSIGGIIDAYQKDTTVWGLRDLDISPEATGLDASPTKVMRSFTPPVKGKGKMLSGTSQEMVNQLVSELHSQHVC
jgi:electron transfer flavoprotein beta subunit